MLFLPLSFIGSPHKVLGFMHKEIGNSSELPAPRRMQNGAGAGIGGGGGGGGAASAEEVNAGPTKRLRRPSVRLHQPYDENGGQRRLQQQWNAFKKGLEGARKPRTHNKTVNLKNSKRSNGERMDLNFDDEDDVAIGSWKNFSTGKRDRDFQSKAKRKRVRPSSSERWFSVESRENEDQENEKFVLSGGGESEKQREGKEGEEEEENLGANGIDKNFEPEDSDPHCSFGNDKLIDDENNGVGNQGRMQRGLRSGQDLDDMEGEGRTWEGESGRNTDRDGVRVWLSQLGLGKYAPLFEVHEVDEEVLPFLTLEDLKDMGINAVGSRRKMYRSIQKLGKGFS